MIQFDFKSPGPTVSAFMKDNSFVRGLRGPVGSGKSVACVVELFRRALQQKPVPKGRPLAGKRLSKWAIIRNSYPMLETTTMATWLQWFPENVWGKPVMNPPPFEHRLVRGDLDATFLFIALDRPEDVKKLLSFELTGAWINEAREVQKPIVDAVTQRLGRFPAKIDGGATWSGLIMDTNAPDEDHWWPIMAGDVPMPDHISAADRLMLQKPRGWKFFNQPGALNEVLDENGDLKGYEQNPQAENIQNHDLGYEYWERMIPGKTRNWIRVYVLNKLANVSDGRPVYPDFDEALHLAKEPLLYDKNLPLIVGVDFGLTPAAVILQRQRHRWLILREIVSENMGAEKFAQVLRSELAVHFPGMADKTTLYGDPAGDQRAQTNEETPFLILRRAGFNVRKAPSNDISVRIGAVERCLTRLVDKLPGLALDPSCNVLRRGFAGAYHYRRLQVTGAERFEDEPHKGKESHVHDALQYGLCGGGEAREQTNATATAARNARAQQNVFARPTARDRRRRASGPL